MSDQVFISYSADDRGTADAAYERLQTAGIRCWMAPRDIVPGVPWSEAIIDGINGSRLMVLIFSARANASQQVEREVNRATHRGIPIVPVRIEVVEPSKGLEYFIGSLQWLDAIEPPFEQHLDGLVAAVRGLLPPVQVPPAPPPARRARAPHWVLMVLGGALLGTVAVFASDSLTRQPQPSTDLSISAPSNALFVDDTFALRASADTLPVAASELEWSSGDTGVLRLADDSSFIAVAPGTTYVRAQLSTGGRDPWDSVHVEVRARDFAEVPVRPTDPETASVRPVSPTAAELSALADSCTRALQQADTAWVKTHYDPETTQHADQMSTLLSLLRRNGYRMDGADPLAPQTANLYVDARVRFQYNNSFGSTRTTSALFRIRAAQSAGRWTLSSCRVEGALTL